MDYKLESSCELAPDRPFDDARSPTPFQLPFPPFGLFPHVGEDFLKRNYSLVGFLQRQGLIRSPAPEENRNIGILSNPYRCIICLASFPSAWLLEQHNNIQHPSNQRNSESGSPGEDKPFKCEQCGQNYRYRSAYLKHQEQNHKARLPADKVFTCDVCGMQFRYLKSFKKHRLNHTLEKLHSKSSNGNAFSRIMKSNGVETEKRFKIISEPATGSGSRTSSLFRSNSVDDDDDDDDDNVDDIVDDEGNNEKRTIKDSGRITAPPRTDYGDNDDRVAKSNVFTDLKKERAASVPVDKSDQINGTRSIVRSMKNPASKTNRGSNDLDDRDETIIDSLECVFPGRGVPNKIQSDSSAFVNLFHGDPMERQKENNNKFSCPFCGKCVRSKENLKLHIRKHTGERPFVCLFCGRAFGGKSDLTRHLRIHTGERPYHCEMCGKCFARADYLSKHLTTHNSPRSSSFSHMNSR